MSRAGVLLMAHGTPSSLEEMPEYLRLVRGGRPASDELVAEMRENYAAIGGRSPLTEITDAQAEALRVRLGPAIPVAAGMRNWRPFIKDALVDLAAAGATRVIGIPMAPQFSTLSVQKYIDAAMAALPEGMQFEAVESFHTHPLLLDAFAERVRAANPQPDELVVFTAHSLPVRVIESGDRYADQVAETARGVAERAGITRFDCAYQSAGRTPEPWIGPELAQVIDNRSVTIRKFLVVPIGFVCDHTEILFDIDVQAARIAREFATSLRRTESLNTSPLFMAMLEDLVKQRL
ncbi:MAG: ferrochelatase [Acidobacteria bacterium]|nr:MAG: ferrochelatase [Acidobacteriota bacterium]PYR18520.1 MAG: ferrochelatase [Acidobacteriota bacterium]PYR48092.1 MAG: ferrochelatase [Acidobacteriota bacterium]